MEIHNVNDWTELRAHHLILSYQMCLSNDLVCVCVLLGLLGPPPSGKEKMPHACFQVLYGMDRKTLCRD